MNGSVKNKIRLGTVFLLLLVLLSAGFSIYYLANLRVKSKNILRANYESLQYAHAMLQALDSINRGNFSYIDSFELRLQAQENNITESGELDVTARLRRYFNELKKAGSSALRTSEITSAVQNILLLNMTAIKTKSDQAEVLAEDALTYLTLIISIIFIISLTFAYNFPQVITEPLLKVSEAIREISQRNYGHRIHIDTKDEFGELARAFNDMAQRLEFFESSNLNKIISEKMRAEAVINSLKDASIGIGNNNKVLFANKQALQLLGLEAGAVVDMQAEDVARGNDLFRFLLQENSFAPFKIVVDGKENYFMKEVVEVSQEGSGSKVIVIRNITTFKELDVAKTNFIATVSHELKTPLASSDFSLRLLEDDRVGSLSGEQRDLIRQLKSDNQRMLRILSELLNMSQVEAGRIQLNIQPVDPYQVVDASLQAVNVVAEEKGIKLVGKVEEGIGSMKADGDKTAWVLNNFLLNAVRYSPAGTEVVLVMKQVQQEIQFAVVDKGIGIEQQYLDKIFERYFQVPGRSDVNGSGIGLAICKDFIEAMHGRVWVSSVIGEGSVFSFALPLMKGR